MEYLDPKKEFRHHIIIMVGYACLAIAITIATLVLLYQAYGFGLGKNGTVIQNSLTFFSSHPNPANIYIDGKQNKAQTNSRLVLPEGIYKVLLARDGYRDWQRTVELDGGSVQHYDYPFLFPKKLETKKIQTYSAEPGLLAQSRDRRWLVAQQPASVVNFDVYDLKNPTKNAVVLTLPSTILTKATSGESWRLGEWADDNQHLLLQHLYDNKMEYILVDRVNPEKSLNLNTTLSASPTKITLNDKKYDKYYLYDATANSLQTASIDAPTPKSLLENVLSYQSYGNDTVLYATIADTPDAKVLIKLKVGDTTYPIRSFSPGTTYLLDLTKYSNSLYVTAGASSQNKVYIYKDPIGQLHTRPKQALIPTQVLHVEQPNYLSFSNSAQFVMAQSGNQFGVYDIENKKGFSYITTHPLDQDVSHATWMDGNRLMYVSGGKLLVFDYDNTNQQELMANSPRSLPAFSPDYAFVYGLTPSATAGQTDLSQTSLLSAADHL
ncbi:MAG: hypothetical protein JWL89_270 [Candidatus Saccharibacteria bacterium]|nr:hypothetical protein [Candidatus Saccharibacteria bacterium]